MIIEKCKLTKNVQKSVTRVCDECGKIEKARMATIFIGREKRKNKIDLCRKCSCSPKYKPKSNWPSGEDSHLWRGGRGINEGRVRIRTGKGNTWEYEHRMVMAKEIGRQLTDKEVVHHVDFNSLNNNIDNLFLYVDGREHTMSHHELERLIYSLLEKQIWFDYNKKEYTLVYKEKNKIDFDLSFLNSKKIGILTSKESPYALKKRRYFNESLSSEKYHKYRKTYMNVAVMEKYIERKLYKNEVVHHIDNNSMNDDINNLILMTISEHGRCRKQLIDIASKLYEQKVIEFKNGKYVLCQNT